MARSVSGMTQGVLISQHDSDRTRTLYAGARIHTREVRRNIASKASSRQKARELLAVFGRAAGHG